MLQCFKICLQSGQLFYQYRAEWIAEILVVKVIPTFEILEALLSD